MRVCDALFYDVGRMHYFMRGLGFDVYGELG